MTRLEMSAESDEEVYSDVPSNPQTVNDIKLMIAGFEMKPLYKTTSIPPGKQMVIAPPPPHQVSRHVKDPAPAAKFSQMQGVVTTQKRTHLDPSFPHESGNQPPRVPPKNVPPKNVPPKNVPPKNVPPKNVPQKKVPPKKPGDTGNSTNGITKPEMTKEDSLNLLESGTLFPPDRRRTEISETADKTQSSFRGHEEDVVKAGGRTYRRLPFVVLRGPPPRKPSVVPPVELFSWRKNMERRRDTGQNVYDDANAVIDVAVDDINYEDVLYEDIRK